MGDCNIYVNCDNKNEHIESLIKRVIAEQEDGTLAVRTCCVEGACTPYVECDKRESVESLFKKLIVENEDGSLAVRVNCCSSTPVPPVLGALELTFDDISNAALLIGGDVSDYTVWNTFFGFDTDPTLYTTQFTSVTVAGNKVYLYGGSGITLRTGLFSEPAQYLSIIKVEDNAGCLVGSGYVEDLSGPLFEYYKSPFWYDKYDITLEEDNYQICTNLTTFTSSSFITAGFNCFNGCTPLNCDFSALTTAGDGAFGGCIGLVNPDFSAWTTAGGGCFMNCTSLTNPDFSALITCGDNAFNGCTSFAIITLPVCTALGATTGYDDVFNGITNQTITLTIPLALMTDGDVLYLIDPLQGNTVTIIQV
jgi:hypothetical protein